MVDVFKITSLDIPATVKSDEVIETPVVVKNTSESSSTSILILSLGTVFLGSKDFSLGGGEERSFIFRWSTNRTGEMEVCAAVGRSSRCADVRVVSEPEEICEIFGVECLTFLGSLGVGVISLNRVVQAVGELSGEEVEVL